MFKKVSLLFMIVLGLSFGATQTRALASTNASLTCYPLLANQDGVKSELVYLYQSESHLVTCYEVPASLTVEGSIAKFVLDFAQQLKNGMPDFFLVDNTASSKTIVSQPSADSQTVSAYTLNDYLPESYEVDKNDRDFLDWICETFLLVPVSESFALGVHAFNEETSQTGVSTEMQNLINAKQIVYMSELMKVMLYDFRGYDEAGLEDLMYQWQFSEQAIADNRTRLNNK